MLNDVFNDLTRVLHLVVHAHNFFTDPKCGAPPEAVAAAYGLVEMGESLQEFGVPTHCALLSDMSGYEGIDEAYGGVFPPLKNSFLFANLSIGYRASVFWEVGPRYRTPMRDVFILTGFNRSLCAGETALDCIAQGYQVVMPLNLCVDGFDASKSKREDLITLKKLKDAGVILVDSSEIMDAIASRGQNLCSSRAVDYAP